MKNPFNNFLNLMMFIVAVFIAFEVYVNPVIRPTEINIIKQFKDGQKPRPLTRQIIPFFECEIKGHPVRAFYNTFSASNSIELHFNKKVNKNEFNKIEGVEIIFYYEYHISIEVAEMFDDQEVCMKFLLDHFKHH